MESADVRIRDGMILERGKNLRPRRGEEVEDLKEKILMPGFVNAHTHLYSSLARGMPAPKEPPRNFLEILLKVWWKLDRALDDEAIYYSAMVGAIEAVRRGTTTLVDHHASPRVIKGSLDIVRGALHEVGLRGVLCYEVTDRGGKKERDEGLDENERFICSQSKDGHFRGLVGAHASFTLNDESLRLCGELASTTKTGVHIHVAEDKCDVADAEENYRCTVVDRLGEHKILRKGSILAHCVHLNTRDFLRLRDAECWLVHNPRSNMNNRVGSAPVEMFGQCAALGTDGLQADMFEEAKCGFLKRNDSHKEETVEMTRLLQGGQRMISELFGVTYGTLAADSAADLVVLDYDSPTPVTTQNLTSHFLFGMQSSMVGSVMVGGKWVVKNGEVVGVDTRKIYQKAARVAKRLWERISKA